MVKNYYPEISKKPRTQIESRLSCDGKHFVIDTPYDLQGKGITKNKVVWNKNSYKYWHEWKSYCVTKRAYDLLSKKYDIACEVWFD